MQFNFSLFKSSIWLGDVGRVPFVGLIVNQALVKDFLLVIIPAPIEKFFVTMVIWAVYPLDIDFLFGLLSKIGCFKFLLCTIKSIKEGFLSHQLLNHWYGEHPHKLSTFVRNYTFDILIWLICENLFNSKLLKYLTNLLPVDDINKH